MIYVIFLNISVASPWREYTNFVLFILNQNANSKLYPMKKNNFTQVAFNKVRGFFRPMFYNGRNGLAKVGDDPNKDRPWFI